MARVEFFDGPTLVGSDASPPYEASWNTQAVADGPHSLRAVAFDPAGNSANAIVQAVVDNTAPTVAVTAPSSGSTVSGTVTVAANASDTVAVARVELYDGANLIGTATTAPYAVFWNTTETSTGAHTLKARAYDTAGNSAESVAVSVTVSSDMTSPTVVITAPIEGSVAAPVILWSATGTDNVGVTHIQFFCDNILQRDYAGQTISFTWATSSFTEGGHTLTARAFDAAGNSGLSQPVHITIDRTTPTVAVTSPTSGARISGMVPIVATASDNTGIARVEYYDGDTKLGAVSTPPSAYSWDTLAAADGVHSLTAVFLHLEYLCGQRRKPHHHGARKGSGRQHGHGIGVRHREQLRVAVDHQSVRGCLDRRRGPRHRRDQQQRRGRKHHLPRWQHRDRNRHCTALHRDVDADHEWKPQLDRSCDRSPKPADHITGSLRQRRFRRPNRGAHRPGQWRHRLWRRRGERHRQRRSRRNPRRILPQCIPGRAAPAVPSSRSRRSRPATR